MSEKLLIERLKSLAEEVRGPVKDAMLDAAMALTEADALAARLAEAEHLILRMAGEDYQRARFYVEKYDLTGERPAASATAGRE